MATPAAPNYALLGRLLVASAAVIFLVAILAWNGVLGLAGDTRFLVAGALTFAGLADLGLGIFMLRRGAS